MPVRRPVGALVPVAQPALTPGRSVIRDIGTHFGRGTDESIDVNLSPEGIRLDESGECVRGGFEEEEVARREEGEDGGDELVR